MAPKKKERCPICTLPMPCCSHSPSLGDPLCGHCLQVAKTIGEAAELVRGEVVGVVINREEDNEELVYGVVEEDKASIHRVVIWTKVQPRFKTAKEIICKTIKRTHVQKIRGRTTIQ